MGQEGATSGRTVASGRHAMAVKLQAWHRGNMGRTKAASERSRQSWHANIWRFKTNAVMQWRGVAAEMRAAQRTKKERLDSSVSHGELGLTREVLMLHELGFEDPIACKRALVLVDGDLKAAVRELAALEQQPERGHRHSMAQSMTSHHSMASHHSLHRAESNASSAHHSLHRAGSNASSAHHSLHRAESNASAQHTAATKLQAWHRGNLGRMKAADEQLYKLQREGNPPDHVLMPSTDFAQLRSSAVPVYCLYVSFLYLSFCVCLINFVSNPLQSTSVICRFDVYVYITLFRLGT